MTCSTGFRANLWTGIRMCLATMKAETSADVKRNWEALKVEERKKRLSENGSAADAGVTGKEPAQSILAGISSAMPALLEAHKLSSRAAQVGFDWPNIDGLFEKLSEETCRTSSGLAGISRARPSP